MRFTRIGSAGAALRKPRVKHDGRGKQRTPIEHRIRPRGSLGARISLVKNLFAFFLKNVVLAIRRIDDADTVGA